ncbi:TIGR01906 family membrane protein [Streptococcus catagoni]|uniref:TIGR01906 family membrane protein n=1 Tax=Streptococcus catagoni TaxID=2654874 RepID=UPI00140C2F60|nr:TIGR01906 family membrane protein [Streptococcus catagoni]
MKTEKFLLALTCLWLLALSTLVTIYGAWLFYPIEIDHLHLTKVVYMEKETILYHFNGLMDYLTNPFISRLSFASFSSSKEGLAHFQDVKYLFHLAQAIFLILLVPAVRFLCKRIKNRSIQLHGSFFLMAVLLPILIGVFAFMMGFDSFFTLFHQLLFPGKDNWTFDPLTDPVIWILPETFFMHCFMGFFLIYESIFGSLYLISRMNNKKRQ